MNPKQTTPGAADLWKTISEHGSVQIVSVTHTRLLAELAAAHRKECAETFAPDVGDKINALELKITGLAAALGCNDVVFTHDPRGCTVRLLFRDGYSNSIAGGYAI